MPILHPYAGAFQTYRLVGEKIALPFAIATNPWIDDYGWMWFVPNGASLGKAGSGATIATDKAYRLYKALWATAAYTISGGKAGNYDTDWSAGKILVIPDMRGRVELAAGQGSGLTNRAIGTTGGAETHTLTSDENAPHAHGLSALKFTGGGSATIRILTDGTGAGVQQATDNAGLGSPHNNMQPWKAYSELWFMGEQQ